MLSKEVWLVIANGQVSSILLELAARHTIANGQISSVLLELSARHTITLGYSYFY